MWKIKTLVSSSCIFLILVISVLGRSNIPPEAHEYYSKDKVYRFEVFPPKNLSVSELLTLQREDYRRLALDYPTKCATDYVVSGRLSKLTGEKYDMVWQRVLENRISPVDIAIVETSQGVRVVSINDYFLFRDAPASLVIYSPVGKVLATYALRTIASEEEIEREFSRRDSADVLKKYRIENDKIIFEFLRESVEIDLLTGAKTTTTHTNP